MYNLCVVDGRESSVHRISIIIHWYFLVTFLIWIWFRRWLRREHLKFLWSLCSSWWLDLTIQHGWLGIYGSSVGRWHIHLIPLLFVMLSQKDVHHQIIGFSDLFRSPQCHRLASSMKDFMWRCVTQKLFAIKPSGQIKFSILLLFPQKGKWNEFLFIRLTEYQKESHSLDTQYVLLNEYFLNFGQRHDDASRSLNSFKCKLHFNSLFVLSFIESSITYAFHRFDKDN